MLRATLNQPVPLQVLAADGKTDLYAQAALYADGSPLATVSLPHIDGGLYGATYTATQEGYLSVVYKLFYDAGLTVPADYDYEAETVEVSSDKTNILRILGLLHENAVLDQQTYDGGGSLISARLRVYDSKTNALSAGLTGLSFTYAIQASYSNGQLTNWKITRET